MKFGIESFPIFGAGKRKEINLAKKQAEENERIEQEKIRFDHLNKFIKERMGLDPKDVNLHYEFVAKKEIDPTDPDKIKFITKEVENYHDFLVSRSTMNEEQKEELDTGYRDLRGHWDSPAVFAHEDFWKRLGDKDDPLNQYHDEFNKLTSAALKGELEDEYDSAVKRGEIKREEETPPTKKAEAESEPVVGKPEEVTAEVKKVKTTEELFKEKFNLNLENLRNIEGFNDLSEGQQRLVLENLEQLALGRIEEEAISKYKKGVSESSFLGKLWQGISKKYQIAKLEKSSEREIMAGGMEKHGEVLKQLVNGLKNFGPEVEMKNGKIEMKYVIGLKPENQEVADKFNEAAMEYSKIPYEWSLETASGSEQKKYIEAKEKYEAAKETILNLKKAEVGDKEAMLYLNDIDSKVNLNRFLSTHPEIEKQLEKVTDKKAWRRVFGDIITERGLYFSAGYVGRAVTTSLIGMAGIPLAAGAMGGYLAYQRSKQSLREKDIMARKGEVDKSKEAKNFVGAADLTQKLDYLINKIENTLDEQKKNKLINSLKTRISYTQDKIDNGLVNFGTRDERIKNQYDLLTLSNRAKVYIDINNQEKTELDQRLESFLNLRNEKISSTRKKYIIKQTLIGAGMGAGFAAAGYAIRYLTAEWMGWGKGAKPALAEEPALGKKTGWVMERITGKYKGPVGEQYEELTPKTGKEAIEENVKEKLSKYFVKETEPKPEEPVSPPVSEIEKPIVQKGDSIWTVARRYLETNPEFKKLGADKAAEALQTYNIDRVKDIILQNPEKYGLPEDIEPSNFTIEDLQKIKFKEAIGDTFSGEDRGLTTSLSEKAANDIIEHNKILKQFFIDYPKAPRTADNYEAILKGKGLTGKEIPAAPIEQPEGYDTTTQAAIEKIRAGKMAWEADEAKQAKIKKLEESMMEYVKEKQLEQMDKAEMESLNEKLDLLRSNEAKRLEWVNDFVKNNLGIELKEATEIPYIAKRLDNLGINFYDPDKFKIPALSDQADKFRFFLSHQDLSDDHLKSIFDVYDQSNKKLDLERMFQQMEIERKAIFGSDIREEGLAGRKEIPPSEAGRPEDLIEIKPTEPGGGDEELIEIKLDKKLGGETGAEGASGRDSDLTDLTEEEKIALRQQGLKPDEKISVQRDSSKPRLTSEELKDIRAGIIFEDYEKMLKAPSISSQEVPRLAKRMSESFIQLKGNLDITKHIRDIFAQEHFKTKLTAKELDEFGKNVKELLSKSNKLGLEELLRETLHKISGRSYIEKPK